MIEDMLERQHAATIEGLVRRFGEDKRDEITEAYNQARKKAEETARIKTYIPVILQKD